MSCLIKCMKIGITNGEKNKDFDDAFRLIKYYTPYSLAEIYDAWQSKVSKFYKDALVYSAINLFENKHLDMDAILYELDQIPLKNNLIKEMCDKIKENWNLWEQLDEEIESSKEFNYDITIDKLHLYLLSIESLDDLLNIINNCKLDCTLDQLCSCIDFDLFIEDLKEIQHSSILETKNFFIKNNITGKNISKLINILDKN